MMCSRCKSRNTEAALFCAVCGLGLRAHDEVECENHSGMAAIGVCAVCGKPVCGDCSVARENKLYCEDVSHSQLTIGHTKFAAVSAEFEADMIIKNLTANGVPAIQHSAKNFSQFCLLTDNHSVSIFVKTESMGEARRLIDEMDLKEFLILEEGEQ